MTQGTDEWLKARLGWTTGSRIVDIMPGVKGKYLASRKNYMAEKVIEILTDESPEHFVSEAMQWGTDTEPLARSAYEAITGNFVDEDGFVPHPTIPKLGASPDGIVNPDGCIEIKCPNSANHLSTILGSLIKRDYIFQMQCEMMCLDKQWCDFISYDPRMPDNLQIFIQRIPRDEVMITEIEMEVKKFQGELQEMLAKIKEIK